MSVHIMKQDQSVSTRNTMYVIDKNLPPHALQAIFVELTRCIYKEISTCNLVTDLIDFALPYQLRKDALFETKLTFFTFITKALRKSFISRTFPLDLIISSSYMYYVKASMQYTAVLGL